MNVTQVNFSQCRIACLNIARWLPEIKICNKIKNFRNKIKHITPTIVKLNFQFWNKWEQEGFKDNRILKIGWKSWVATSEILQSKNLFPERIYSAEIHKQIAYVKHINLRIFNYPWLERNISIIRLTLHKTCGHQAGHIAISQTLYNNMLN